MKRVAVVLAASLVMLGCATRDEKQIPAVPVELRTEVLIHHIQSARGVGTFSLVDKIDWEKRAFVELPPEELKRILQRCPGQEDWFVPVKHLRLPKEDERDPTSPSGGRYRGIEDTRRGIRVYVLYVSKIERKEDGSYEVYYENYNGPLAGGGGSYIATRTADGWTFKRSDSGWVS